MPRGILLAGLCLLPVLALLVLPGAYFPYIAPRAFAFRIIVEILTPLWLLLVFTGKLGRPHFSPVAVTLLALTAVAGISMLLGVDPNRSFWSNFERMDGWITSIHLLALFAMLATVLDTTRSWIVLWSISVAVSIVVAIDAVVEFLGSTGQVRVASFLGNPSYLALYLLQSTFVLALLTATIWQSIGSRWRALALLISTLAAFLLVAAMLFTVTRAAVVGLLGGVFVALVSWLLAAKRSRPVLTKRTKLFAAGGLGILIVGGLLLTRMPMFERLLIYSIQNDSIRIRLMNWQIVWEGFLARPFLGWGQENYKYLFAQFYDPMLFGYAFRLDRPHNVLLEWLLNAGIVGLLLYLAVFAAAAWMLWRNAKPRLAEKCALAGFLAASLSCNLFMFDNLASYILLTTVLAYIHWSGYPPSVPNTVPDRGLGVLGLASCGAALLAGAGLATVINANAIRANLSLASAARATTLPQATEHFRLALKYAPFSLDDIRRNIAGRANTAIKVKTGSDEERRALYEFAVSELDKQIATTPQYFAPYWMAGVLAMTARDLEKSRIYLERAVELTPRDQAVIIALARNALGRRDRPEAAKLFCRAYELNTGVNTIKLACERARAALSR